METVRAYAAGRLSRRELMDALDTDDFGRVLALLRKHRLKLPRAPKEGRERRSQPCVRRSKAAAGGRNTRPMAIDWRRHFDQILSEIKFAQALAGRRDSDFPEQVRAETAAVWIMRLNRMLRSRHIPASIRAEAAAIPWRAIARLAEHIDLCIRAQMPLPARVIEDFNTSVAPGLIAPLDALKEKLIMTDADGNARSGLLDLDYRGGHAHATIRIPADRVDALRAFVAQAYAGRDAPTLADVRARLATASERLRQFGVEEIVVFGSVAAGTASAASDVDLVYGVREGRDFERWAALGEAFEAILGRVVDAHEARPGDAPPAGAVLVWRA